MQTIKRAAAALLTLALVLSLCPMAPTAYASDIATTTSEAATVAPADSSEPSALTETEPPTEATALATQPETATEAATEPTTEATTEAATEATTPPITEPATEPVTEATTESPTEAATEETVPPTEGKPEVTNEITGYYEEEKVNLTITLPEGHEEAADTKVAVYPAELDDDTVDSIMSTYSIPNILGSMIFTADFGSTVDNGNVVKLGLRFDSPSIPFVGKVFAIRVDSDGTHEPLKVENLEAAQRTISAIDIELSGWNRNSKIVIFTSDEPADTGSVDLSGQYCVRAQNYGSNVRNDKIGSTVDGALTNHCYSNGSPTTNDFAICLDHRLPFGSMSYTTTTSAGKHSTGTRWDQFSDSLQAKLVLLLVYGMDTDSGYAKYSNVADAYGAIQLVAWEWINKEMQNSNIYDGYYTCGPARYEGTGRQFYSDSVNSIAKGLRSAVYNNPSDIDAYSTSVLVVVPSSSRSQPLLAIESRAVKYARAGNLSITKTVSGTGTRSGWRFGLYASQANAQNNQNMLASASTNASGVATFTGLTAGTTYYIRELPAAQQSNSTTGWTLSTVVRSGTVAGNTTTSVGSVSNTAPAGAIQVKKIVTSTNTSGKLNGWIFQVSNSSSFSSILTTITTDASGVGTTAKNLTPGTYYVREAPLANQTRSDKNNFRLATNVVTVTISGSETVLANNGTGATATNVEYGAITVQKTVTSANSSGKLDNWVFQIASDTNFTNILKTLVTDKNGFASSGSSLAPGTYYVREAPLANQTRSDKNNYVLDNQNVITVNLQAGETKAALYRASATASNVEKGMIRVRKGISGVATSADKLQGWLFQISTTADFGNIAETVTTGTDGYGVSGRLVPGTYYVREAPMENQSRNDKDMWTQDNAQPVTVSVTAGSTADALNGNGYTAVNIYGKRIHIQKVAQCDQKTAAQLDGNAMYSLAGAEYNVVVDGNIVETLVTDDTGKAVSKEVYLIGTTGTLVEITAPSGYVLDATPVPFTIPSGNDEYTVEVSDAPTFDPRTLTVTKIDAVTGTPVGDATFEGAVFRWDYYDNTTCTGTPTRAWYFVTDGDGQHRYNPQYLADSSEYSSDELYQNYDTGLYELPLGSVKITEVDAPLGYDVMPVLTATITQESNGSIAAWKWSEESLAYLTEIADGVSVPEPLDEDSFGSLSIQKADKDLDTEIPETISFAGCEFTVVNRSVGAVKIGDNPIAQPGEACYVLTADASGKASTGKIFPVGSYEVRETKGNDYYSVNEEWSYSFSVAEGKTEFAAECVNTQIPITIHVEKVNAEGAALEGAKFILEWSEDGQTWKPVTHDTQIAKGNCSSPDLAEDGSLVTNESGKIEFTGLYPLLTYRIVEAATPNGYSLLSDPILVDTPTYEQEYEVSYKVVDGHVFALPKTGSADMAILPALITMSFVSGALALIYAKKKTK